jgi:class 3 adenylate cyclase
VFALGLEKKSHAMKRQKKKQEKLVLRMLPKDVVDKLNSGIDIAETFDSATLFFSSVYGFANVTRICTAMEVVNFLNELYRVMDDRMDNHGRHGNLIFSCLLFVLFEKTKPDIFV